MFTFLAILLHFLFASQFVFIMQFLRNDTCINANTSVTFIMFMKQIG